MSGNYVSNQDDRQDENGTVCPEDELALLPYMPPLFGCELPPCGLMPQLAYQNVVQRLRKLWLLHAKENPAEISLKYICEQIFDNLLDESEKLPFGKANKTTRRTPWRREQVFKFEPCWAHYFVLEARRMNGSSSMTSMKRETQGAHLETECFIPTILGIHVKNPANKEHVCQLWREWHREKRRPVPTLNPQGSAAAVEDVAGSMQDDSKESGETENDSVM
ncbi:hypothetical protein COCCADRAFT_94863 [Bipolaris zeicola 26-R-13]|uniref:Uncharacterized protein n=1 Tax=Cochliobolus carbonum (strain 26-R-13) TaxID=930089 RepID=W6Y7K9_COCC2|nr:uncharacterized protein COCCADRAFT_94863 [Bipolaris zeicola 26-R-13]EUC33903.1 hypothetical protein COCCADRAFT_94863 [Bipolaris zeicola 26-R-13]